MYNVHKNYQYSDPHTNKYRYRTIKSCPHNPKPSIQSRAIKGPWTESCCKVYEIIADLIVPDDAGEEALDAPPEECPVIIKMDVLYTTAYHCTSVPKLPNWTRTSY